MICTCHRNLQKQMSAIWRQLKGRFSNEVQYSIPANTQSTKTWRRLKKCLQCKKLTPKILKAGDIFISRPFFLSFFFLLDFTFLNARTVHYLQNKWEKNLKRASVGSSQEIWCSIQPEDREIWWKTWRLPSKSGELAGLNYRSHFFASNILVNWTKILKEVELHGALHNT